jgi:hypothetical protein
MHQDTRRWSRPCQGSPPRQVLSLLLSTTVVVLLLLLIGSMPEWHDSGSSGPSPSPNALWLESPLARGPPPIPPGYQVEFSCFYGSISINTSTVCQNDEVQIDTCGAGTCWMNLSATVRGVNNYFLGWSSSGTDLYIHCWNSNCSLAKLTVTLPQGITSETGAVGLEYYQQYQITTHNFVNWTTGVALGQIQICGSECTNYSDGAVVTLRTNVSYAISGVGLFPYFNVSRWTTNAGSLSYSSGQERFTLSGTGVVSMYVSQLQDLSGWIGYVQSPNANTSVGSAFGEFQVPDIQLATGDPGEYGSWEASFWVGVGGYDSTPLWQAGIQFNWTPSKGLQSSAFWEAFGPGYAHLVTSTALGFSEGDKISVNVSSGATSSTFLIQDNTTGRSWSGTEPYSSSRATREWVYEDEGVDGLAQSTSVTFSDITIAGLPATLYQCYLEAEISGYSPSSLDLVGGYPSFSATVY